MKKYILTILVVLTNSIFAFSQTPINTPDNIGSGNCLNFNGTTNYVQIGGVSTGLQGTMETWVNPNGNYTNSQYAMGAASSSGATSSLRYAIVLKHANVCSGGWATFIGNGITSQIVCSGQAFDAVNFPAGIWTHLAITFDGTNVRFYKDGNLVNSVAQTITAAGSAEPFSLGRGGAFSGVPGNTGYFNGKLDEPRIWNIALSQSQIQANMSKKLEGNESGLVGYWNMNEGTGNTVIDLTTNGNDGTLQ